ncbi:hypothetical protein ACLMJK_002841 [Lecanora helva]
MTMIVTACSPREKLWNPSLEGDYHGVNRVYYFGYFQGSWATGYPIAVTWNLQIIKKVKAGLCILMAGGIGPGAAGVAKTIKINLVSVGRDHTLSSLVIWACTEFWLVLILGSLPSLRPLVVDVTQRVSTCGSNYHKSQHPSSHPRDFPGSVQLYSLAAKGIPNKAVSERDDLIAGTVIVCTTRVEVTNTSMDSREASRDTLDVVQRGFGP